MLSIKVSVLLIKIMNNNKSEELNKSMKSMVIGWVVDNNFD